MFIHCLMMRLSRCTYNLYSNGLCRYEMIKPVVGNIKLAMCIMIDFMSCN